MVYSLASLILTRKSHLSFSPYFVSQVLKPNSRDIAIGVENGLAIINLLESIIVRRFTRIMYLQIAHVQLEAKKLINSYGSE